MTEINSKDNPAFVADLNMKEIKNGPLTVSETQVQLETPSQGSDLRNRKFDSELDHPQMEDDDDDDDVPKPKKFNPLDHSVFTRGIMTAQTILVDLHKDNSVYIWRAVGIVCLITFFVYFGFAMDYEFGSEASWRLLVCTVLGLLLFVLHICGDRLDPITSRCNNFLRNPDYTRHRKMIRWLLYVVSTLTTITLVIVVVAQDEPENLWSLLGLAAFIAVAFLTSNSPAMVDWHTIFWGFSIQFYFAIIILKSDWGYETFNWLGDRVTQFLSYSDAGASFVFSDYAKIEPSDGSKPIEFHGVYKLHFFAFKLLPVVTFFSTIITILYYLGVMQAIVKVIGRFLSFCLGTTPAESLNAAGNIFVSMIEAPLMIRPFLPNMTRSELHAVMTGGFATIAGSVLGAYIGFGIPADHLLSASVMSAPAALAISKLTYPEIDEPVLKEGDYDKIEKAKEDNVIEAACNGAMMSAKIIASIIVNVIAFLSLLAFVNATLVWFGERVGKSDFTFQYICSYLLYPVAFLMGTKTEDCRRVAELVGVKVFTNEFIAYEELGKLLTNRKDFNHYVLNHGDDLWHHDGDDIILEATNRTLTKGILSEKSGIIATYALCGFSNFGSMGITLGALSAMAPKRRPVMASLVFRAMIAGNVACFITACVAGLFFESRE